MNNLSPVNKTILSFIVLASVLGAFISGDALQRADYSQGLTGMMLTVAGIYAIYLFLNGTEVLLTRSELDAAEAQLEEAEDIYQDNPSPRNLDMVRSRRQEHVQCLNAWRQACQKKIEAGKTK